MCTLIRLFACSQVAVQEEFFGFPWLIMDTMHGEEAGRNIKYASVQCKSPVAPVTYTDLPFFFFLYLH